MSDYSGHVPADMIEPDESPTQQWAVAGDEPGSTYDADDDAAPEPTIYIHALFVGGDPTLTRVRDVSISIPVTGADTFTDYAVIIETAVRELGKLGQQPGWAPPQIRVDEP